MVQTKLTNMVDPQVLADMISARLEDAIRFSPLANVDSTLVGRPGSTVTVPKFKYIGDAKDVAEGAAIDLALLETDTDDFTIKKAGKGVELTDEAVLSGYGDPMGEAEKQLLMSIANKVDNDVLEALKTTTLVYESAQGITIDAVDGAQGIFNDEDAEPMVLIANPKDVAKLRKSAAEDWTRGSELGDRILVTGVFGEVLGAQVVRSRKVEEGTAYLVKRGALAIYLKRSVDVESDRDILHKTTVITADQHYGAHLFDESKAIKITTTVAGG
ncbi:N4-gp56 family major capsid protein [Cytobacillus sp. FSL W7-1323]|uniref:N4-gp56 family major capsid protein n=1 Tax=Cytobacillus sp. FSL W7-1323 TaxID=2921700 RepID=UPI0031594737